MILHTDIEQNSVDWSILRSGKITASEADSLLTPLGKVREGDGVNTYLNQKLTEIWTGGPLVALQGVFDVEQGKILEERAKPAFTLHTGITTQQVAFIESDDHRSGCSPDAMIGNESGCEIKCPRIDTHVGYVLGGVLPKIYAAQVQFSMYVTGCKNWHFFSYCRALPPLHLVVARDDDFQESIEEALSAFVQRLDAGYEKLVKLNGAPPRRFTPTMPHLKPITTKLAEVPLTYLQ